VEQFVREAAVRAVLSLEKLCHNVPESRVPCEPEVR
jgi:hypothetical protein